jgi:hypothetical protein
MPKTFRPYVPEQTLLLPQRGDELPEELQTREGRLKKIR